MPRCFRCGDRATRIVFRVRDDETLDVCRDDHCTYKAHVKLGTIAERELQCTCGKNAVEPTCGVHGILAHV